MTPPILTNFCVGAMSGKNAVQGSSFQNRTGRQNHFEPQRHKGHKEKYIIGLPL